MSTLEGDAASGSSNSKPRGSKRGACDRCRGQKLRCLRDEQNQDSPQAKCIRCFKAGATCCYGVPKRAGRHPGSNAPTAQERRGNAGGKSKSSGGTASGPSFDASSHGGFFGAKGSRAQLQRGTTRRCSVRSSGGHAREQESEEEEAETEGRTPVHLLSPSSLQDPSDILAGVSLDFPTFSGPSSATLPWPDETLPPFYSNDAGEDLGLEPFSPKYSWAFHHFQAQPMDMHMSGTPQIGGDERARDVGANAYGTPAQTCSSNAQISEVSGELMDLDIPTGSTNMAPFNLAKAPNTRTRSSDRESWGSSARSGMGSTALLKDLADKEAGVGLDEEAPSTNVVQHRRMQELSELAMDLYAQLAAHDPAAHQHQPTTSGTAATTAFQDQLVGSVLKSSNTFLTLLRSFSASTAPPSPSARPPAPTSPASSTNHNSSTRSPCSSSTSPSPASAPDQSSRPTTDESGQQVAMHSQPLTSTSSSPESSKLPFPPTDITIVLQLLTCYIRIIHLHGIIYAHILDYMLAFPQHATMDTVTASTAVNTTQQPTSSVPPLFPGMRVGGVSLDRFGTFQVKLLLQISVHVLGEIEAALGLPEGYRVGKRRRDSGKGFLEARVSGDFVEYLMREGGWRGERERVEFVREQLTELRKVLKGAIDF